MFKRRKRDDDSEVEANLIPVLSCLFLLIPALLLAMEVAPFTSVRVEAPRFSDLTSTPADRPTHEPLRLRVHIREDGFTARYGSDAKSEREVDIPLGHDGEHDFLALEKRAQELKTRFPEDFDVTVSAEGGIPMNTLVESMDALRGHECSLKSAFYGEAVPDGCYFWNVVVQSSTV